MTIISRSIGRTGLAGLFGAVLLSLAGTAPASAQTVEFRGWGYIYDFNAACAVNGWNEGGRASVHGRFRPRNLGTNGPTTRLSFFLDFYAMSYMLESGALNNKFKKVIGGGTGSATFFFGQKPKMKVTEVLPEPIDEDTNFVVMAGAIKGLDNLPDCNVKFELSLTRRK